MATVNLYITVGGNLPIGQIIFSTIDIEGHFKIFSISSKNMENNWQNCTFRNAGLCLSFTKLPSKIIHMSGNKILDMKLEAIA